ncbi:FAD-dependent oxidoreductase [Leucobacter zeae]|nr:FAD-dependent oxidoreductase [Leucobacter zeae]
MVIIGGGLAAATAANELRELGHDGPIALVAAEPHRPYQRPPLSKGYLAGSEGLDAVFVHSAEWAAERDVTLRIGVAAIRVADGTVALSDGSALPFDRLLIATGAAPAPPRFPGADAPNVTTFRTLEDADRLRTEFASGTKRVALIGSGWIGLELAAAARNAGHEVTVITRSRIPLAHAVGDEMGTLFQRLHEEHGVAFALERSVTAIAVDGDGRATGVVTDRGTVAADLVIVGIGAVPETALAETAGVALGAPEDGGGILVDAGMRTSVPGVFAAGDVATPVHPALGTRLRSEHWAHAIAGGRTAAAAMLGRDAALDDIPYFFTDQYDLGMEYSGYAPLARDAALVVRGDASERSCIAFWVADGRVVAGMNVNVWEVDDGSGGTLGANEAVQRLIRSGAPIAPERLLDPAVPLGALA